MKNSSKILKSIMVALGMEVKLEQMMLIDGVTKIEADSFEPDMELFIITDDEQKIPMPIGEYELEDGRIVVVVEEGIISEIKEKMQEDESKVVEEVEAEQAPAQPQAPQPKSIIEATTKEYKFSQEDIDAKDAKIAELEAKIVELTKVEVELEEAPKPITHNPENKSEIEMIKFGSKEETKLDRIFKILND